MRRLNALVELGHFHERDLALRYLEDVQHDAAREAWTFSGAKADIRETETHLAAHAWANDLTGHWELMTGADNKSWDAGEFVLNRAPGQLRLDRDYQEVRFGVVPILNSRGWHIADAATAMFSQGDKHALIELAHFGLNYRERAEDFLNEVEDDLDGRGVRLAGQSHQLGRAVYSLEMTARENGLHGTWAALDKQQAEDLANRQLSLTHERDEVRTMSTRAWAYAMESELKF